MVSSSNSIVINTRWIPVPNEEWNTKWCTMYNVIRRNVRLISILFLLFAIGLKQIEKDESNRLNETKKNLPNGWKTFKYGAHETTNNVKVYYEFSVKWSKICVYVDMINEAYFQIYRSKRCLVLGFIDFWFCLFFIGLRLFYMFFIFREVNHTKFAYSLHWIFETSPLSKSARVMTHYQNVRIGSVFTRIGLH